LPVLAPGSTKKLVDTRSDPPLTETAAPPRNFTVTADERLRALVAGPPAYVRRRRRIEDLEAAIVRFVRAHEAKTKSPIDPAAPPAAVARAFASLRQLIETHNRYYPIEANLSIDMASGRPLEMMGKPWAPMPVPALEVLLARCGG
jgi:hypothetical protein